MKISLINRPVLAASITALLAFSQSGFATTGTVVTQWNAATLEAIRVTHPGPPIVARALAIVDTCMFDAWAAYDAKAKGTRFAGNLRRPSGERTNANKEQAISFAAHECLSDLFPSQITSFNTLLGALGYNQGDNSVDVTKPSGIGNVTAKAVLSFRHHDGSNQLGDLNPGAYTDYTGYTPN